MSKLHILFVDHPDVDPFRQDNPICVRTRPIRGQYWEGRCFSFHMPTLRYAIQCGYTYQNNEGAYPVGRLDKRLLVCHSGHAYLRFER